MGGVCDFLLFEEEIFANNYFPWVGVWEAEAL